MSAKYDLYLQDHVTNVKKAFDWLVDHGLVEECAIGVTKALIGHHDSSKRDMQEYDAYDDYFYGPTRDSDVKEAFDYAWLHHIHNNPHHWQYWVLMEDDSPQVKGLEMPIEYVYEMFCDWWSFSWAKGDLNEIFDWYVKHEKKMVLHYNTKRIVENLIDQVFDILKKENNSDE